MRYVRDYLNGSTSNSGDHWVEIEVYGSRTVATLGNYYEWDASSSTPTKYYYAGAERVAMRIGTGSGTTGLKWLVDDQLGSTAITADGATGAKLSELRYKPWGEIRYAYKPTMTDRRYTGQRAEGIGLYDYGARWYDAALGRFVQADSIIPEATQGVQAWDRYAYANNNPIRYNDPSGHCLVLCTAIIGAAVGAIVGAVGYTAYTVATGKEFNTGNMLLAAGGGAVAGALIGTGVGIAAGMSAAAATTAAVTGGGAATTAATTVLNATGGDPSDEINAAAQAAQQTLPAAAQSLGQTGETLAGIVKNTTHIPSLTGTANYRIPDQLIPEQNLLSEVKHVSYQAYTSQIKDFFLSAQQQGFKFEMIARQNTGFSKPLQALINAGKIILKRNLPPQ